MQENYLAKWLTNDLSEEELAEFKRSEAYASYEKIVGTANSLEGPSFDMERALHDIQKSRTAQGPKVIRYILLNTS